MYLRETTVMNVILTAHPGRASLTKALAGEGNITGSDDRPNKVSIREEERLLAISSALIQPWQNHSQQFGA